MRWFWFRPAEPVDVERTIRALEKRLADCETALEQHLGQFKLIRIEWEQVYEKFRTAMSKLARREERSQPDDVAPGRTNGTKTNPEVDRWNVRR